MMLRKTRKEGAVAKLNQLVLLENMLETYDAMNLKDANLTRFQGMWALAVFICVQGVWRYLDER